MQSLGDKTGESGPRIIAARRVHGEVDPTSEGCVVKSGRTVGRRSNATLPFRTVYPEKGGRVVTSAHPLPIKCVKTATWSRSVNSEDFQQITSKSSRQLVEIFLEIPSGRK